MLSHYQSMFSDIFITSHSPRKNLIRLIKTTNSQDNITKINMSPFETRMILPFLEMRSRSSKSRTFSRTKFLGFIRIGKEFFSTIRTNILETFSSLPIASIFSSKILMQVLPIPFIKAFLGTESGSLISPFRNLKWTLTSFTDFNDHGTFLLSQRLKSPTIHTQYAYLNLLREKIKALGGIVAIK